MTVVSDVDRHCGSTSLVIVLVVSFDLEHARDWSGDGLQLHIWVQRLSLLPRSTVRVSCLSDCFAQRMEAHRKLLLRMHQKKQHLALPNLTSSNVFVCVFCI